MEKVTLTSASLRHKSGFEDGDVLDEILWEAGFGDDPRPEHEHLFFHHEVLAELVEKWLLPLIPDVPTYRVGTIHNPIRVAPEYRGEIPPASVIVDAADVIRQAEQTRAVRAARATSLP